MPSTAIREISLLKELKDDNIVACVFSKQTHRLLLTARQAGRETAGGYHAEGEDASPRGSSGPSSDG